MGNVQGGPNPLAPPPQYYQSQQMRYSNPMSVQSAPSPAPINSPMIPIQQQQPLAPPYQSINSPMQPVNQQQNYQHNLNSPLASQIPQHIQSPMMPQSVQSQHMYSPMPSNSQLNSNLNSPLTHSYQINSPMPNQSPITTNTSQQHYQSMSHNSPLPPLTPQQYHQPHQQMHHSSSSIPSTPTMMVNSPYNNNNNSYNQYNHHYQNHDQFNTSANFQSQNVSSHNNYDLNYVDNTDYYNQQYMMKQQQQQQQMKERERELEKERELKEKEMNEKQQRKRFLVELEFVQCLANPNYLHYLAKEEMFDNDSFKNYLKYLLYWKRPEYIQFIKYPECLFFLDLLQNDELQQMIKDKNCVHFICEQQMLNWKYKNHESFMKTVKTMSSEATTLNETKNSDKLSSEKQQQQQETKMVESKSNIKIQSQKSSVPKTALINPTRANNGLKSNAKS